MLWDFLSCPGLLGRFVGAGIAGMGHCGQRPCLHPFNPGLWRSRHGIHIFVSNAGNIKMAERYSTHMPDMG